MKISSNFWEGAKILKKRNLTHETEIENLNEAPQIPQDAPRAAQKRPVSLFMKCRKWKIFTNDKKIRRLSFKKFVQREVNSKISKFRHGSQEQKKRVKKEKCKKEV